ncbi:hypothetical protein GFI46_24395 [Salmonella enterica subsp. enterica]|nr:hypothetical protein [Salmonella enterica]EBX7269033.1 hypothetical protein [Salmonella enterica subsp. enterica serovar Abony]EDE2676312.1 hypothetical protein [Salmonella enterica subsp. enterica serovar Kottbus]EDM2603567.1 hypothetical protein [Salmonella enterica subsp. enterica serovar Typhimurium]EDS6073352.1 hypothetical protein [Salmonella enterica subsp. enterica serovar Pomona]EEC0592738.1 hypothetical protein [Salmonella enterica subsp. enterica serovar Hvittingfoss]HAH6500640.
MDPLISDSPAKLKQISGGFCIQGLSFRFTPIPGRYYRERPTRMNTVNVGKLPRRYIRINYLAKDPAKNNSILLPKIIKLYESQ